jgi:hypothetical protein
MRRLSIKLEKAKTRSGWYYFSTDYKEIFLITKHNIPGLTLLLRSSKGIDCRMPVSKSVPVKEKLNKFKGYFGFEYEHIKNNIVIDVDILS